MFPVGSLFRLRVSHHLGRATFTQPRRVGPQHADFPHCALLFASPQGLWGLSCRSGFRCWSNHSVAIEQLQSLVQPSPTPPRPAEALSVPGSHLDVQSPELPGRVGLRLDVYSPPQVLQIRWTPLSSRPCLLLWSETFTNSRVPSLHGRYPASTLLQNPSVTLSPSIDVPVEPVIRSTLLRRFRAGTRRASPVARHVLAHRAVASTPPN